MMPARCGVKKHLAGTDAARFCAANWSKHRGSSAKATMTAPPPSPLELISQTKRPERGDVAQLKADDERAEGNQRRARAQREINDAARAGKIFDPQDLMERYEREAQIEDQGRRNRRAGRIHAERRSQAEAYLRDHAQREMFAAELCGEPAALADGFGADARAFAAELAQAYASSDPQGWTSGCGLPHPLGGYHSREITAEGVHPDALDDSPQSVVISHLDAGGRPYRTDGFAKIDIRSYGVVGATWCADSMFVRQDGPGFLKEAMRTFDAKVPASASAGFSNARGVVSESKGAYSRFVAACAAGASAAQAVEWLHVGAGIGHDSARELQRAGGDATPIADLVGAGVLDMQTLTRVARGELPASWALAGL